jgi:hypothetical protein
MHIDDRIVLGNIGKAIGLLVAVGLALIVVSMSIA